MKIGPQITHERRVMRVSLLMLTLFLGLLLGSRGWLTRLTQLRTWIPNLPSSDLPILQIDMAYEEYNFILQQRDEALDTGVYLGTEADYRTALVTYGGQRYPVRLRLQEGPARHLGESDKWNWEVRLRNEGEILGLRAFELLDPTENNWLNQYAFSRALEEEGVLVSRYQFVRLFFNGNDLGVYAVQEAMTVNLPLRQGLPPGVIVAFDNSQLWQTVRYFGGDEDATYADPITNLSATDFLYFQVDAFDVAAGGNNSDLNANAQRAIELLRGLQTGTMTADTVFDADKYGRFLALSDLWAAIDGTSLVHLRYYFNPLNGRLEPIGYNSNPLADNQRIALDSTYNNLALQTAYVQAAERFADPAYLAQLQQTLDPELAPLLSALQKENPDLTLPWEFLSQRQNLLQRSLAPTQPVFAYLGASDLTDQGYLEVQVANVTNLALQLVGFQINETIFLPTNNQWIVPTQEGLLASQDEKVVLNPSNGGNTTSEVIRYTYLHIPLTAIYAQDPTANFQTTPVISVGTRLDGLAESASATQWTPALPVTVGP